MMKHQRFVLVLTIVTLAAGTLYAQQFRVSTSDLRIASGSQVLMNEKAVGTAPCIITTNPGIRYKMDVEFSGKRSREFSLTVKNVQKAKEVDNVPLWFVDPSIRQTDFPSYSSLTPSTATASSLQSAIEQAERDAKTRIPKGMVNRYNTIREDRGRLDSSSSSYYPNLTRGQMDSLNAVNGGKMVAQSFPASTEVEILEYEIQKIGKEYRVYVLAGRK